MAWEGAGQHARAARDGERGRDLDVALARLIDHREPDAGAGGIRHRRAEKRPHGAVRRRAGRRQEDRLGQAEPHLEAALAERIGLRTQHAGEHAVETGPGHAAAPKTSAAFVPPKPKEFESATWRRALRAHCAT